MNIYIVKPGDLDRIKLQRYRSNCHLYVTQFQKIVLSILYYTGSKRSTTTTTNNRIMWRITKTAETM